MSTGYTRQAAANIAAGLTIASADINAECNQLQSAFDITTGHDHSGSSAGTGAKVLLTSSVSGTLPVANGGTGVTASTGTGNTVLSVSPTFTGTITAANITASGTVTTPTLTVSGAAGLGYSTSILLRNTSGGGVTNPDKYLRVNPTGGLEIINSAFTFVRFVFADSGALQLGAYGTGALSTDGSGNVSAGTLSIASGGTGTTTSTGTGSVVLSASPTLTGTITAAAATLSGTLTGVAVTTTGAVTINVNASAALQIQNGAGTNLFKFAGNNSVDTTAPSARSDATNIVFNAKAGGGLYLNQDITGTTVIHGSLQLNSFAAGALSTDGSGNVSAGTLPVANGGTGTTTSTGTGSTVLSASPTFTGTLTGATINGVNITGTSTVNTITYQSSGVTFAFNDATYHYIYDKSARQNIILGGTGDQNNYYRNVAHNFQSPAGADTYLAITNTAIQSSLFIGILKAPNHQLELLSDDGYKPNGGSWGNSSDARIKQNIDYEFDALSKITALKPALFEWINPEEHGGSAASGGFIAQDMQQVFPEFITKSKAQGADKKLIKDDKMLNMSLHNTFFGYLVKAIQELNDKIDNK